ncbi:hypothetical protein F441_13061 [Phytophthora nicotianae CJ01A1]|uniref:Uncharacterized protein n=1 Tax=Phytophthora nicotianae CJ01A1 TaxID=1317063 RepID=W2WMP2_PHYNI|nr:hypothetical protein F441_13061 [Phytophthora nicotianae CJ01A1]
MHRINIVAIAYVPGLAITSMRVTVVTTTVAITIIKVRFFMFVTITEASSMFIATTNFSSTTPTETKSFIVVITALI